MSVPDPIPLVRRAVAGDRQALEALWNDARRWVAVVLAAAGARGSDLPDLLQETACDFVAGIGSLRAAAAFRPWLRQLALNALRSSRRRRCDVPLASEPSAPDGDPLLVADEVRCVWSALAGLPAAYREPLLLRSVEGLSQRAVAETLGLPETTIETRLARARRLLRAALAGRADERESCPAPRT